MKLGLSFQPSAFATYTDLYTANVATTWLVVGPLVDAQNATTYQKVLLPIRSIGQFDEVHVGGAARLSVLATGEAPGFRRLGFWVFEISQILTERIKHFCVEKRLTCCDTQIRSLLYLLDCHKITEQLYFQGKFRQRQTHSASEACTLTIQRPSAFCQLST